MEMLPSKTFKKKSTEETQDFLTVGEDTVCLLQDVLINVAYSSCI